MSYDRLSVEQVNALRVQAADALENRILSCCDLDDIPAMCGECQSNWALICQLRPDTPPSRSQHGGPPMTLRECMDAEDGGAGLHPEGLDPEREALHRVCYEARRLLQVAIVNSRKWTVDATKAKALEAAVDAFDKLGAAREGRGIPGRAMGAQGTP